MKAYIYLRTRDSLDGWGFANRRRLAMGADAIWVAPPEYVIVRKLEYFREGGSEKHVRDVRAMLEARCELDRDRLAEELRARGLEQEWRRVTEPA